ncbi:ribonuclease P protein component [Antrihabitans stalactiti]|uniref:Ribonuclease P protein component n=1 Tax=Antrihabitans stalactiti TaxID=2584121 RepID=A0A848K8Q0_9NOCA|nr:ribonuclease P protein component [Antrihabitans stalactiti]
MLPEPYRLHHHSDFSRTVRHGHRAGRRDLVVHVYGRTASGDASNPLFTGDGPRFGLIVGKGVGGAVVRHRVARQLRHVCHPLTDAVSPEFDVVVRALPGAATATSSELSRQLHGCLRKLKLLADGES